MRTLIEKNKSWLSFYSLAARITGWAYIILNIFKLFFILFVTYDAMKTHKIPDIIWPSLISNCLFNRLPLGVTAFRNRRTARSSASSQNSPDRM